MRSLRVRLAHTIVLATAAAITSAACAGGDELLTMEEFVQTLEEIDDPAKEAIGEQVAVGIFEGTDEEFLEERRDRLRLASDVLDGFLADVAEISPPEEAAAPLEEMIASGREYQTLVDDVLLEIEDATSSDAFFNALDEHSPDAIFRFDDACRALEQLAADHTLTLDLRCPV